MINFNSKIIKNENITHEGVLAYIGILFMSEGKITKLYTNINAIEVAVKDSFELGDRYFKEKIKRGLLNLSENKIIEVYSEKEEIKPNNIIVIHVSDFSLDKQIEKENIIKILSYEKSKKFEIEALLRYYLVCTISIDVEEKIGRKPISELAVESCISDGTIKGKYNKILEDLKLIYICRNNTGNIYGEYKDKELVDEWYRNNKYTIDNPNIEKIKQICRNSINEWKDSTEKVCCITKSTIDIEIHHSKSFQMLLKETIEELNIDLNNFGCSEILDIQEVMIRKHRDVKAIPLTRSLHKELHRKYGQIVTEEETLEFINEKLKSV